MASDSVGPKPTLLSMTKQLVSGNAPRFARPAARSSEVNDSQPVHASLTAEEVLRQMDGADEERLAQLALEPACPESVLTTFVNGPNATLRAAAARNPRLNLGLLSMLAHNSQEAESVLLAVTEHPSTSPESLRRLARSAHLSVRIAAALHPSTPLDALLLLAGVPDIPVQLALAARADLTTEVQRALLEGPPSTEVLRALVSGPFVDEVILAALTISVEPDIRLRVAVHPRLPAGPRQSLSADPDWSVRQAAMSVSREDEGDLILHPAVQPSAIQEPVVDDRTYLEFLTAEQRQERQDLVQAFEALNSEALELTRQRWLASLNRPPTVDEQRLRAAHQGRVLELERESRLTLERDLRILRQNLQAEGEREKYGASLSLSKSLEQERQALREELKSRRARQLLEERTAIEQRRMENLAALRAQQATEQQQTLASERAKLTSELERFLNDQRAQLQAEANKRLQTVRMDLEQKLQTELRALRKQMEAQSLRELGMLQAAEDERTAARQLELELALERLLDDQRLQLQTEEDERWAGEKEAVRQLMEARLAEQELQAQVIRRERLTSEHARQRAELEAQGEALMHEWRCAAEEALALRQEQWEAEMKQAQSELAMSLKTERDQRLAQQRQQLDTEFVEVSRTRLEQLQQGSEAELQRQRQQASSDLAAALDEQRQQLEAEKAQLLGRLLAEHEASANSREAELATEVAKWRRQNEVAREQLRTEGRRALVSEAHALKIALAAEVQQELDVRRQRQEAVFREEEQASRERQQQTKRALEAQLRQKAEDQLEAEWSARAAELRAAHEVALSQDLATLAQQSQQSQQSLVARQAETDVALGTRLDLQTEQLTAELAFTRQKALTAQMQLLISEAELVPTALPTLGSGFTTIPGTLVGGHLVPSALLPADPEPVLRALQLILTHLDVQEEALARLAPDGQSHRAYLRSVNRVIEGFMHGKENIILRADREDGPHYFYNERVPRLTR